MDCFLVFVECCGSHNISHCIARFWSGVSFLDLQVKPKTTQNNQVTNAFNCVELHAVQQCYCRFILTSTFRCCPALPCCTNYWPDYPRIEYDGSELVQLILMPNFSKFYEEGGLSPLPCGNLAVAKNLLAVDDPHGTQHNVITHNIIVHNINQIIHSLLLLLPK